ncbi:MAG: arylsulfatase [Phycisphaerae bacterium]|nr:arylsulfatase [Phycisphaerae bacterium]
MIAACGGKIFGQGANAKSPNVIFILADDMGIGDVGCYNDGSKIPTPNLDKLAKGGMMFKDAHTNSSVCTPTRYGIMTGRYAWRTERKNGVTQGFSKPLIKAEQMTVASFLKGKGYRNACIGKWHLGMDFTSNDGKEVEASTGKNVDFNVPIKNGPIDVGFDYYFGISASLNMPPHGFVENRKVLGDLIYMAKKEDASKFNLVGVKAGWVAKGFKQDEVLATLTAKTIDWIKEHRKANSAQPFFVYMPLNAPHAPLVPGKEFAGKSDLDHKYGDFCMEVDSRVGQIMATLDELGIADNTLVIFTADNGCSPMVKLDRLQKQGHYPGYIYRGLKGSLWDAGHRVPFIARWPDKVKANSSCDDVICVTDLLATLAEMQGERLPDEAGPDSVSFYKSLQGEALADNDKRGIVHHSDAGIFSIRRGKWKLVLDAKGGTRRNNPKDKPIKNPADLQLFDMVKDPSETTNVQHEHQEVVIELKKLLAEYVNKGRSRPGKRLSNDPVKHWPQIEVIKEYLD